MICHEQVCLSYRIQVEIHAFEQHFINTKYFINALCVGQGVNVWSVKDVFDQKVLIKTLIERYNFLEIFPNEISVRIDIYPLFG